MIRYLSPWWLLAVLPVLGLAGLYVLAQLRRRAHAVRFSNVDLLRQIAPKGLGWRRHAPAVAFLMCLLVLALGMARPATDVQEPMERATVVLAIDVSLSMMSEDVAPSRFRAARSAAKDFVKQLPDTFNIGLVAFSKSANVVVSPTKEHDRVRQAIDNLELAEGTDTGGKAYEAYTQKELKQVYQDMGSSIGHRTAAREIAQWFIGLALLFAFAAAGMSLLW